MIHTSRTVTVGKMESVINEPIMLYRGDREVEIEFNIVGSKFMFSNGGNVIKSTNATNGQLVINTPTGENMFSEVTECNDGKVISVITKEMIDELAEVGFYSFQIRLFDESQVSRVTIPPVYQGIEIRNPIAAEDETDLVDIGLVDYSVVRKDNYENVVTFLPNGDYNKTLWKEHDVISKDRLNKVEDALYEINKGTEALYQTFRNKYDEFSVKVNKDVKAYKEEMEDEVEQFERNMTQAFGEFKVDYKDEVHDRLDVVEGELDGINTQLEHIENTRKFITPEDFGAIGDGKTDDYKALQDCINESIKQGVCVFLKNKYYTSKTLDISNIKGITGVGHNVIDKWDSRTFNGEVVGAKWFLDHSIPYDFFVDGCSGSVIFSDAANPIVKYAEGTRANFENFAICGSFKNIGQVGFADVEVASSYNGSTFTTNNFKITHCGGTGMSLKRGMEYFQWVNTSISNNGGYGVLIDRSYTLNPCEYSTFNSCVFENNMLDGFHLKGMRRGIIFNTCNFSRNGQYQLTSSSDRNRECPSNHVDLKAGVRVTSIGNYSASCLELRNCFAEETQNILMLDIISAINNVIVESCQIQNLQRNDKELLLPSALVVTKGNYIGSLYIKNNLIRKDTTFVVYNDDVAHGADWTIEGYADVINDIPTSFLSKNYKTLNIDSSIITDLKYNNNHWEIAKGLTEETTVTTLIPKEAINNFSVGVNRGYKFAFFYIGYNHSATNGKDNVGDIFGITKGNRGKYEIIKLTNNIPSLSIDEDTGAVSFTCPAWKSASLQRIEMGNF